jgi:phosphoribosylformylglycinamidine synthase
MRAIVTAGLAESSHDLSDGGLACALATCGGAVVTIPAVGRIEHCLFGEAPSRILLSTSDPDKIQAIAQQHSVQCIQLGMTSGGPLRIKVGDRLAIDTHALEVQKRSESAFPHLLHVQPPS